MKPFSGCSLQGFFAPPQIIISAWHDQSPWGIISFQLSKKIMRKKVGERGIGSTGCGLGKFRPFADHDAK